MAENFNRVFAENGGKTSISDIDYGDGWDFIGDNPPEVEDFNSVMNEQDRKLAEIHREGVVTYDANTDYAAATSDITKGSDGNIYRCLIDNGPNSSLVDPVGDVSDTWESAGVQVIGGEPSGALVYDNGFKFQWGEGTTDASGNGFSTYPVAFVSTPYQPIAQEATPNAWGATDCSVVAVSKSDSSNTGLVIRARKVFSGSVTQDVINYRYTAWGV